jgi:hypothetical protein
MFTNPHFSVQLASDRQRDMLAEAEQHRRADLTRLALSAGLV